MKPLLKNISTLEQLRDEARLIATMFHSRDFFVICLVGDLAAGKTTFTQFLAKEVGIVDHVQSPTYTLERQYVIPESQIPLYHYDLYRLSSMDDLYSIGLIDRIQEKKGIFVIEWPEIIVPFLKEYLAPDCFIKLTLQAENDERTLCIEQ